MEEASHDGQQRQRDQEVVVVVLKHDAAVAVGAEDLVDSRRRGEVVDGAWEDTQQEEVLADGDENQLPRAASSSNGIPRDSDINGEDTRKFGR